MNIFTHKPYIVVKAAEKQKGMVFPLELLCFFPVFLVCSFAMELPSFIAEIIYMLSHPAFREAVRSGSVTPDVIRIVANSYSSSNISLCIMLWSEILMIVVAVLFCKFLQKRSLDTIGFVKKGIVKHYLIGLCIGFLLFSAAVGFCVMTGSLTFTPGTSGSELLWLLPIFVGFMIQGMAEEVLCRGYLMVSIARRYPVWAGILANSLFFAMLHLLNNGITPLAFLNLVLYGVFASLYFLYTENIWGIGALHSVWNFVQGNFYGISVSGNAMGPSLFRFESVGSEVFNGGAFGLEGGLGVTLVLTVGIVILIVLKAKRKPATDL